MKNKNKQKQEKTLVLMNKLINYASENKLPLRIIDELDECKKQLILPDVDWDYINRTVESILNSMEQKTAPQAISGKQNDNEVSPQMVQAEIKKMAQRCRSANSSTIKSMTERKNTIVKKNYEQLSEISHTKAHIEELKNEDVYLQFFQTCKTKYERDSFEMFRELLQNISENYSHMLNQMKSMFQSIDGYKNNIGNEKFYYEYEEQKNGIEQRVLGEVQTADFGGHDVMSFAQVTKKSVNHTVKKLTRYRKLLAWFPIIVLLCVLTAGIAGKKIEKQQDTKQIEKVADNENTSSKETSQEITENRFTVNGRQSTEGRSIKTKVELVGLISVISVLIYMAYLKMLKSWSDRRICKQCGEYLKTELYKFEQSGSLKEKLDMVMENATEEYERQYMDVLNHLFQDTHYDSNSVQTSTAAEFSALRAEWNDYKKL